MLIFLRALNQLYLSWFKPIKEKTINRSDNDISITIKLLSNSDLDITLTKPDLSESSDHEIIDIAEQYASFLLYFNSKTIKSKILTNLENHYKNSANINDKLFFDNVLAFYEILQNELDKAYNNSRPIVRPISVFSAPNH